ncbi:Transposable element Tcb1 transposase [Labeo rohita]|uniref:Transposable element Tcb1 transposase n=1 Tax=Labeo rohita TaxID=84645 RepID=A0ABQ8LZ42_LABRO|nr:Transposable element Tcb1 transposase [Labeo rohita]
MFNKAPHGKELSEDLRIRIVVLHKDGLGYKRLSNNPKLSTVQNLASKNRCMSAASIALEIAEVEGQLVSAQTIRCTLQQVGLHWRHPRRKPLLKPPYKKGRKQFAEDNLSKSMTYWNHVLWSVKHGGGSIMVWGCVSTAGTGELRFIEGNMDSIMYCTFLKQNMMPSLQKLS